MTEPARLSPMQVLEGHYVVLVLDGLHRTGVLTTLRKGATAAEIARSTGFDQRLLLSLLTYVAHRCDALDTDADGYFQLRDDEAGIDIERLLDLYAGGFGPCLRDLPSLLREPAKGNDLVDWRRHGQAFSHPRAGAPVWLMDMIDSLEVRTLLDLGCGGGALLHDLARRREDFVGFGIDANASALAGATARARTDGLSGRLSYHCGDVLEAAATLSAEQRDAVEMLVASSLVNAYFGERSVDDLLAGLQELFPRKVILISDYYGRLGHGASEVEGLDHTLLHDLAQIVSGQGVPPPDVEAWKEIYARNACTLVRAVKTRVQGIERYLHMVQL